MSLLVLILLNLLLEVNSTSRDFGPALTGRCVNQSFLPHHRVPSETTSKDKKRDKEILSSSLPQYVLFKPTLASTARHRSKNATTKVNGPPGSQTEVWGLL